MLSVPPRPFVIQGTKSAIDKGLSLTTRVGSEAPWGIGRFYGSSYFVDPRGRFLAEASEDQDEVVVADLDLDLIDEVRHTWQFFRDRRPDSYGKLTEG